MKTKTPTSPTKLRLLGRTLHRVGRHNEGLALHGQLRLALLQCIHGGHWTAGDRVPTEAELIEATALSAGTVQRALRDLTDEGVLRRQQGSGSFVASAPHRIDDVAHCRFFDRDGVTVLPSGGFEANWVMLNFTVAPSGAGIVADLSPLNGTAPAAIRYAWDSLNCCDLTDPNLWVTHDCIASCPIMSSAGLPANPFSAKIVGGRCECQAPQVCS